MVKKVAGWLLGLGLLVVAVPVWAEDAYAGRYVAQVQEIELRLQFIAQGKTVQGRMVWPPSAVYDFRGEVTQPSGNLVGVVRIKDHGLFFAARRQGGDLLLLLMEAGPDGKPDDTQVRQLMFQSLDPVPPSRHGPLP